MSVFNTSGGLGFTVPSSFVRPLNLIVATKRANSLPVTDWMTRFISADNQNCYVRFGQADNYLQSYDGSGNYGASGDGRLDPGLHGPSNYTSDTWAWWLLRLSSQTLRQARFEGNDFGTSPSGTQNHTANPSNLVGSSFRLGDDDSVRFAHLHFFTADVSTANFNAIRAGTLNPADVTGHLDGFPLASGLTSLKGVLTLNSLGGTPAYAAGDNPTVASGGGGGGSGARLLTGGFGW